LRKEEGESVGYSKHPRRKKDHGSPGATIDHQNKNLPWSVQMGYQSTIGLTPSKTKITHGSLRITLPTIALRLRNTETSFPQFVQDGECATFGPFLRTINTITSRLPRRVVLTDAPLVGGFCCHHAVYNALFSLRFLITYKCPDRSSIVCNVMDNAKLLFR